MLRQGDWRRSSRCERAHCVEVRLNDEHVEVRDSKAGQNAPVQRYTSAEWDAFLSDARDGEFDLPA